MREKLSEIESSCSVVEPQGACENIVFGVKSRHDGKLYRCTLMNGEKTCENYRVKLIDFGKIELVNEILDIPNEFKNITALAEDVYLEETFSPVECNEKLARLIEMCLDVDDLRVKVDEDRVATFYEGEELIEMDLETLRNCLGQEESMECPTTGNKYQEANSLNPENSSHEINHSSIDINVESLKSTGNEDEEADNIDPEESFHNNNRSSMENNIECLKPKFIPNNSDDDKSFLDEKPCEILGEERISPSPKVSPIPEDGEISLPIPVKLGSEFLNTTEMTNFPDTVKNGFIPTPSLKKNSKIGANFPAYQNTRTVPNPLGHNSSMLRNQSSDLSEKIKGKVDAKEIQVSSLSTSEEAEKLSLNTSNPTSLARRPASESLHSIEIDALLKALQKSDTVAKNLLSHQNYSERVLDILDDFSAYQLSVFISCLVPICVELSQNSYGSKVILSLLRTASGAAVLPLQEQLLSPPHVITLVKDPLGSLCVKECLAMADPGLLTTVLITFLGQVVACGCHPSASSFLCQLMKTEHISKLVLSLFCEELLSNLDLLIVNEFGVRLVEAMLEISSVKEVARVLTWICNNLMSTLRNQFSVSIARSVLQTVTKFQSREERDVIFDLFLDRLLPAPLVSLSCHPWGHLFIIDFIRSATSLEIGGKEKLLECLALNVESLLANDFGRKVLTSLKKVAL